MVLLVIKAVHALIPQSHHAPPLHALTALIVMPLPAAAPMMSPRLAQEFTDFDLSLFFK